MESIVELEPNECEQMLAKYERILSITVKEPTDSLYTWERCEVADPTLCRRYYYFKGKYTQRLIDLLGRHPDEDEIIMLVDRGYFHFGAQCKIDMTNKEFAGIVYID